MFEILLLRFLQPNLEYFLLEKNCIDQLCVTARDGRTVIYENTPNEPTVVCERNVSSEMLM